MQYQYGGYSLQSQTMGAPNAKYKTMLCRHYECNLQLYDCSKETKQCSVGSKCQFAHGANELRQINDPLPPIILSSMTQPLNQPTTPHNYKSIQCKYHIQGYCKNGNNCTFIHDEQNSEQQLLQQQQNPYYANQNPQQSNEYQQQYQQQDPQINFTLMRDQQVLMLLLQDMAQFFPRREDILNSLHNAEMQVQQGKLDVGVNLLKQLLQSQDFPQSEREQYSLIYDRSKQYFIQITQQYNQQYNNYQQ